MARKRNRLTSARAAMGVYPYRACCESRCRREAVNEVGWPHSFWMCDPHAFKWEALRASADAHHEAMAAAGFI